MNRFISLALYLILAPFVGALLDGIDRKITARMQGRKGPSIFQPFYDLIKLFSKQMIAVGFYLATGSFRVDDIIQQSTSVILMMPGLFVGYILIMAIKLRKSPFDLSTSHHAHQEVVKGITTEMSGPTLAIMEIGEYYEKMLLLAVVALFFINSNWYSWIIAIIACLGVYFIEIVIDNVSARINWRYVLNVCWLITLLCGGINILILMLI